MTDGEATAGKRDPELLLSLVDTSVTNMFIGFGIEHDTRLLNRLGSGAKSGYYFIDKLENCVIVYGEVLHGILYKLLFDVAISINTVHNLEREECAKALQEIERVSRKGSFITVDAYRNAEEKERMYAWNLTAKTIMSVDEWVQFFKEIGYTGDYFWFIP
jgi:hypothetical protein